MSWKLLYWILGLIVLLPFFNFLLGVHPPRFQTDDDPKRYGLDYESVSFPTSDGLTLRGWFIPAASAAQESSRQRGMAWNTCGTVLVGHGYPFDKANILRHALFLHPAFIFSCLTSGISVRVMGAIPRQGSWKPVTSRPPLSMSKVGAM